MRVLITTICLCFLGGATGISQVQPGGVRPPGVKPGAVRWLPPKENDTDRVDDIARKRADEGGVDDVDAPEGDVRAPDLMPVTLDAGGYSTTIPRRLQPGGEGKIVLTMVLKDHVVITPDTPFELHYLRQQGVISLGESTLKPAEPYEGDGPLFAEMVWDGSAVFEIPLYVDPHAPAGEHGVALRAEFELKDRRSGFSKGRFRRAVPVKVRVEEPVESANASIDVPIAVQAVDSPRGVAPGSASGRTQLNGVMNESFGTEPPAAAVEPGQPSLPGGSLQVPVALWVLGAVGGLALLGTVVLLLTRFFRS